MNGRGELFWSGNMQLGDPGRAIARVQYSPNSQTDILMVSEI